MIVFRRKKIFDDIEGARGLHQDFLQTDFSVVSDRGEWLLSENSYHIKNIVPSSGVMLPFVAPLLIFFAALTKILLSPKKTKKKVATFFSVFLIGFLPPPPPPVAFCTSKYIFSRRPIAKLAETIFR